MFKKKKKQETLFIEIFTKKCIGFFTYSYKESLHVLVLFSVEVLRLPLKFTGWILFYVWKKYSYRLCTLKTQTLTAQNHKLITVFQKHLSPNFEIFKSRFSYKKT